MVSAENIDNMKIKYDNSYHWIAGTEVTEVQERVRSETSPRLGHQVTWAGGACLAL